MKEGEKERRGGMREGRREGGGICNRTDSIVSS